MTAEIPSARKTPLHRPGHPNNHREEWHRRLLQRSLPFLAYSPTLDLTEQNTSDCSRLLCWGSPSNKYLTQVYKSPRWFCRPLPILEHYRQNPRLLHHLKEDACVFVHASFHLDMIDPCHNSRLHHRYRRLKRYLENYHYDLYLKNRILRLRPTSSPPLVRYSERLPATGH